MPDISYTDFERAASFVRAHAQSREPRTRAFPLSARMLETAFFASLAREEGEAIRLTLVVLPPGNLNDAPRRPTRPSWECVPFSRHLPLDVPTLTKLAHAADPWSTAIAIYCDEPGAPYIWGLVDQQIHFNRWRYMDSGPGATSPAAYRITIEDAAHLSIYWNFTPLVRIIREEILLAPCPVLLFGPFSAKLDFIAAAFIGDVRATVGDNLMEPYLAGRGDELRNLFIEDIKRILLHIQKYRHGGAMLICSESDEDLVSKYPIQYPRLWSSLVARGAAKVRDRTLFDAVDRQNPIEADTLWDWFHNTRLEEASSLELDGSIQFVAAMARVDGAIWLDNRLTVHGFGTEITAKEDPPNLILATNADATPDNRHASDPSRYGMRHRSMMRYCYKHPDALGFVVSQDGPVKAMTRVGAELLYWDDINTHNF